MSSKSPKWNSLGDFLKAKEEREKEIQENPPAPETQNRQPPPPVTPVTPVTPVPPVLRAKEDAAPSRDFTRTANSIVRDAIPAGLFTGKCKQLYDFLYLQTRGAIVPQHSTRIPTDRVMRGAGMSRHTFRAHVQRLIRFGLVEVEEKPGEHGGNVYTVHLPEEIEAKSDHRSDRGHTGHTGDKVPREQGSQSDPCDPGLNSTGSIISRDSNTSFKTSTENDDDEAAAAVRHAINKMIVEVTGREATSLEYKKMVEVIEVLTLEAKIAAARTTVSSTGPFLAEHLRRRLFKKNKQEIAVETAASELVEPSMDINQCPDCAGVGWYYPERKEKGMAKCSHPRLIERQNNNPVAQESETTE
jgi:hypothetical protein